MNKTNVYRAVFAALILACAFGTHVPVDASTSIPVHLTIDGRAVSRTTATNRGGVVYVELVGIVRAFSGLVVFDGATATVSIGSRVAVFTTGSSRANLDGQVVPTGGKAYEDGGDRFVPLQFFATRLARATIKVNGNGTLADITSLPPAPPTATPSP